jgi:hypothetical protein
MRFLIIITHYRGIIHTVQVGILYEISDDRKKEIAAMGPGFGETDANIAAYLNAEDQLASASRGVMIYTAGMLIAPEVFPKKWQIVASEITGAGATNSEFLKLQTAKTNLNLAIDNIYGGSKYAPRDPELEGRIIFGRFAEPLLKIGENEIEIRNTEAPIPPIRMSDVKSDMSEIKSSMENTIKKIGEAEIEQEETLRKAGVPPISMSDIKPTVDAVRDFAILGYNAVRDINVHEINTTVSNALDNKNDKGGQNITSKSYAGPTTEQNNAQATTTQNPGEEAKPPEEKAQGEQSKSDFKTFALNILNKLAEKEDNFVAQGNAGLSQLFSQGNSQDNDLGRG